MSQEHLPMHSNAEQPMSRIDPDQLERLAQILRDIREETRKPALDDGELQVKYCEDFIGANIVCTRDLVPKIWRRKLLDFSPLENP